MIEEAHPQPPAGGNFSWPGASKQTKPGHGAGGGAAAPNLVSLSRWERAGGIV